MHLLDLEVKSQTRKLMNRQIPAAMILLYVPHTYAGIKAGKNQDIANPRKTEEHLAKDDSFDKVVSVGLVHCSFLRPALTRDEENRPRAVSCAPRAAHANANETIGLYAAAVVAANVTGVEAKTVNYLTLG